MYSSPRHILQVRVRRLQALIYYNVILMSLCASLGIINSILLNLTEYIHGTPKLAESLVSRQRVLPLMALVLTLFDLGHQFSGSSD